MKKLFAKHGLPPFLSNRDLMWVTLFISLFSIIAIVTGALYNLGIGLILLGLACVGMIISFNAMNRVGEGAYRYLSDVAYQIRRGEEESLLEMPMGVMILDSNSQIAWINPYLQPYFSQQNVLGKRLNDAAPGLKSLITQYWDSNQNHVITWNHHHFVILIQKAYRTIYLLDITPYYNIKLKSRDEKLSIGEIFLDNYAEVTQSMSDQNVSNLHNYVTNMLSEWAHQFGIYLKQLDDDHFMILSYTKSLMSAEGDKFKILDQIRNHTSKQNLPLTLSMGIAYGKGTLDGLAKQAQSDLNLALGRGGDQVVVKARGQQARFYGGKTNPMEKRTRVRARMTSQALQELIKESDQVIVQGHMHPDMDALGACLGVHRIARMNNKQCWIVLRKEKRHSDVQQLLDTIKKDPKIGDAFVSPADAVKKATDKSILVMVDHSKPSISISQKLYERLHKRVVIIDHHRRGEEFPAHPLLVYIEPYASSACELITEMISYQSQDEPINKIEATAMLSGIVTDTQSFSIRTGTRTFDAASYLRSAGANVDLMHQFMQENLTSYLDRDHLISRVELNKHRDIALVVGEKNRVYDPVTAAQAADSLLTVRGVVASFVATKRPDGLIGISARSDGTYNVQLIMERLGGGGHLSSGATQIKGASMSKIQQMLKKAIKEVNKQERPNDHSTKK
ncbi:DHH family phosphoesterase [Acetilactobacillus jinshanensis]|uniref:Cyclic-di-AMP phosphodiesterase n=1 Tax=Acetilactobacillus jinshanensis TaxID=1720083 RepID=A0A4P6ZK46_9LACO|nr:DHH family phosphoesterase [Acetilactobacillus jinshanensis]QBP17610.1 hypothetical protein ELX58_00050 [Acetilactobacillus jinshanensis]URL61846.1 hypothetical protein HGK75_07905 [uncultured bacterium]